MDGLENIPRRGQKRRNDNDASRTTRSRHSSAGDGTMESQQHNLQLANVPIISNIFDKLKRVVKPKFCTIKFLKIVLPNRVAHSPATVAQAHIDAAKKYTLKLLDDLAENYEEFESYSPHLLDPEENDAVVVARTTQLRERFCKSHYKTAAKCLNEHRVEVQQAATKKMREYLLKAENEDLIPAELIVRCALRTLDWNDDDHKAAYAWYYVHFLPAVAGNAYFGRNIRNFDLLSVANLPNQPNSLRVPASTEAMAVCFYENHFERVQLQVEWKEANPGQKIPNKRPADEDAGREEEDWPALYVSANAGRQDLLGGWYHMPEQPGIRRFIDLQAKITKARIEQHNAWQQWEQYGYTQSRLPVNNNGVQVQGNTLQQWEAIRATQRRNQAPPAAPAPHNGPDYGAMRDEE